MAESPDFTPLTDEELAEIRLRLPMWGHEPNGWATRLIATIDAERAKVAELTADRDELLPPLTPDREAIMARLDEKMTRLSEDEQGRAKPFLDRREAVEVIQIARHMLRYANDAESGNVMLRASSTRYRAALEQIESISRKGSDGSGPGGVSEWHDIAKAALDV